MKQDYLQIIEHFDRTRSLLVGDVMLDRFIYGETDRISPEAPIAVLRMQRSKEMLGGAGNVARNIVSLGGKVHLVSLLGDDQAASHMEALAEAESGLSADFMRDVSRKSTVKTRYIAGTQQLLRADEEDCHLLNKVQQEYIILQCHQLISDYDCLIISDYAKGTLSAELIKALIELAGNAGKPVLIDPKQWDISLYKGATLLCPNEKEAALLNHGAFTDDDDMIAQAQHWCRNHSITAILITRGAKGMTLVDANGLVAQIAALGREVYDVSGAGDTVLATLACSIASGTTLHDAAILANHAAAIAVSRLGTATVYRTDLKTAIYTSDTISGRNKIFSLHALQDIVKGWQERGLTVGFTNGCFDIIHAGHISSLSQCKRYCDRLILAVNSDDSVSRLKGPSRPVNNEMDRALLLAALSDIDAVVIFREDTPLAVLETLKPNVLMKGEDYQKKDIVGWELVESYGGRVQRIPLVDGYSTTNTIAKLTAG